MYQILKAFLINIIRTKFLFCTLISLLFLVFNLIDLFLYDNFEKYLPLIAKILTLLAMIGQMLVIILWKFIGKNQLPYILGTSLASQIIQLFTLYFLHHSQECTNTKKSLIEIEEIVIFLLSLIQIVSKKGKITLICCFYVFFCFEWGLFVTELVFSVVCSLILFLVVLHFLFFQDRLLLTDNKVKNPDYPPTENTDKHSKRLTSTVQFMPTVNEILTSPSKLSPPICLSKSAYSTMIVNSIKEGIVVFDKNFKIKWNNSYLKKILNSENVSAMEEKLLNIKQDENFVRIQNNFLKSQTQYTQLFKAFQTKIEPLKSFLDHDFQDYCGNEIRSPLLSTKLKPTESREIKESSQICQSLNYVPSVTKTSKSDFEDVKLKNEYYLNKNAGIEFELSFKLHENKIKTLSEYLKEIYGGMTNSLRFLSSEVFSFNKYNMYGSYIDEETNESKLFFIRFFPYKDEIVVMLKHMPENDVVVAAMNDALSQNRLFASMCHELRTPLNYMTNILEIMQGDLKLKQSQLKTTILQDDEHYEYVENALMSSKLLISSVNDFLDFFSISSAIFTLNSSDFSLKQLMKECFELFTFLAKKKEIIYIFEYEEELPPLCNNDEKRLQQIILNLLANAFKYTDSGSITLKAKKKKGDLIQISVQDTGSGIPMDLLVNLGKISPQSSSTRTTGGFGICISNHLVNYVGKRSRMNDNKIYYKGLKVETEENKGTKFSFLIPYEKVSVPNLKSESCSHFQPSTLEENKESDIPPYSNETAYKFLDNKNKELEKGNSNYLYSDDSLRKCVCKQLLAIDDNQFNLLVIKEKFKKSDIPTDLAQSGDEGIAKVLSFLKKTVKPFCNNCKFYKLILMDIDMPIKNGYETTKELIHLFKEYNVSSPIVALSAFGHNESKEMALQVGMEEFIEKPLTHTKFEYLVNKYLGKKITI